MLEGGWDVDVRWGMGEMECGGREGGRESVYFYFEEVLGWTIDFLEGLLARFWHCLHDCGWGWGGKGGCLWGEVMWFAQLRSRVLLRMIDGRNVVAEWAVVV